MYKGILHLDRDRNRLMICATEPEYGDYDVRCGESLEVLINGKWEPTRAEIDVEGCWYLVGVYGCLGLYARVS